MKRCQYDFSYLTGTLQPLRINPSLREAAAAALVPPSSPTGILNLASATSGKTKTRVKDLLYVLLIADGHIVTLLRPRRHSIHPSGVSYFLLCFLVGILLNNGRCGDSTIAGRDHIRLNLRLPGPAEVCERRLLTRRSPSPAQHLVSLEYTPPRRDVPTYLLPQVQPGGLCACLYQLYRAGCWFSICQCRQGGVRGAAYLEGSGTRGDCSSYY